MINVKKKEVSNEDKGDFEVDCADYCEHRNSDSDSSGNSKLHLVGVKSEE